MTAASYECCIVETVGVGQSEVEVDKAVDMMVLIGEKAKLRKRPRTASLLAIDVRLRVFHTAI